MQQKLELLQPSYTHTKEFPVLTSMGDITWKVVSMPGDWMTLEKDCVWNVWKRHLPQVVLSLFCIYSLLDGPLLGVGGPCPYSHFTKRRNNTGVIIQWSTKGHKAVSWEVQEDRSSFSKGKKSTSAQSVISTTFLGLIYWVVVQARLGPPEAWMPGMVEEDT